MVDGNWGSVGGGQWVGGGTLGVNGWLMDTGGQWVVDGILALGVSKCPTVKRFKNS